MQSLSRRVWAAHGSPLFGESRDSFCCYLCGGSSNLGEPVGDWMGGNFTDQNRVRNPSGQFVCAACCFVSSRITEVQGRPAKEGKKFGGCFRNYSHCIEGGEYFNASKGEKPLIRAFLERKHICEWGAAIADSGQLHVIPFTRMNFGNGTTAGVVLFDKQDIAIPDDVSLIERTCDMLTTGATKDEILSGNYRIATIERCGDMVRAYEREARSERGGNWFSFVVWLAQRDEEQVATRLENENAAKKEKDDANKRTKKPARNAGNRDDISSKKRVSARVQRASEPGLLDSNREQNASGVTPSKVSEPLVHVVPGGNAADKRGQLGLFGDG